MTEAAPEISWIKPRAKPIQVGERFGRWLVIGEAPHRFNPAGHRLRMLQCRCDCGREKALCPGSLRYGSSRSCGCLQKEVNRARCTTHGATVGYQKSSEYQIWRHIRARCRDPKNTRYSYYGGRGITVCDRWFDSFEAFRADMGPKPHPSYSVERVDNNGPYSPENCRWASKTEQARNTRRNRIITVRGQDRVLAEIAEATGLNETSIRNRIERGWDLDRVDDPRTPKDEAAKRAGDARWAKVRAGP